MHLETERLIIRDISKKDYLDFYEFAKDDEVSYLAGWLPHQDLGETLKVIKWAKKKKETYAIVLKAEKKLIGTISLYRNNFRRHDFSYELGYSLNKDYWGQKIMPEAVKRIIKYCFEETFCDVLMALSDPKNERSRRVLEKCGFKEEGKLRDFLFDSKNQKIDVIAYSILRKEYGRNE